jgi:hypothetical protein
MPPRNSCEKQATIDSETPSALRPGAVTAMFIAVFGGGFCVIAVVIGAERSHALAASAFFTRTSTYEALVI